MISFSWPNNFPTEQSMFEMLQKTAKASWKNGSEFTSDDIYRWLDNFTGEIYDVDTERRIALWLLCNFTFYNREEINHLCYIVFKQLLHEIAKHFEEKGEKSIQNLLDNVFFAAMGDPSESGGLLLYFFRQQSDLSLSKFYYPTALPQNDNAIIVFIDDVTLSGETGKKFFEKNLSKMKYEKAYYITLFASQTAISLISQFGITVLESTFLSDRERCFSDESLIFASFPCLRKIAENIAREYGEKICPSHPLGFKNGQYCFGLYYNTPNNTLPIFWSNNNWNPIFPRKEKKYHDWRSMEYDRYI